MMNDNINITTQQDLFILLTDNVFSFLFIYLFMIYHIVQQIIALVDVHSFTL